MFDAFVSYSHSDAELVSTLVPALENFVIPTGMSRGLRLFRDRSALRTSPDLSASLVAALESSRHFLLVASPTAAQSSWVEREVQWWLKNRSTESILIVLARGTINSDVVDNGQWSISGDALPGALAAALKTVPHYTDLRSVEVKRDAASFRDRCAEIVGALTGTDKDVLVGDHLSQASRRRRLRLSVQGLLILVLVVSLGASAVLRYQRGLHERTLQSAAELGAELGELDGPYGPPERKTDTKANENALKALGDLPTRYLSQARTQFAYVKILCNLGAAAVATGRFSDAEMHYKEAEKHVNALKQIDNGAPTGHHEWVVTFRTADLLFRTSDTTGAIARFRQALDLSDANISRFPTDATFVKDRALSLGGLADALVASRRYEEAVDLYRQTIDIARSSAPSLFDVSVEALQTLAAAYSKLSVALRSLMRNSEAMVALESAFEVDTRLLFARPDDPSAQSGLAATAFGLGEQLIMQGHNEKGRLRLEQAWRTYDELVRKNPTRPDFRRYFLQCAVTITEFELQGRRFLTDLAESAARRATETIRPGSALDDEERRRMLEVFYWQATWGMRRNLLSETATAATRAANLDSELSAAKAHDEASALAGVQALGIGGEVELARWRRTPSRDAATAAARLFQRALNQLDSYVTVGLLKPLPMLRRILSERVAQTRRL